MSRRPLNVLTGVSLFICAASLVLVGRSVFRLDAVLIPIGEWNAVGAVTIDAQLVLGHVSEPTDYSYCSESAAAHRSTFASAWQDSNGIRWLIGWESSDYERILIVPLWLVPILAAILPVRWWRLRRRGGERGFAVVSSEART